MGKPKRFTDGAQDIYLTGNPQITFFKVVYRRHTNFSMESIEQVFNGQADFGKKVTANISRNGDLITKTYLRVQLPDVTVSPSAAPSGGNVAFRWLNWVGHIIVKTAEVEIGGQRIDKHYAEWLHIWNELTQTAGHALGYANLVGNTPDLTALTTVASGASAATVAGQVLYVPFQFWFNRSYGLALPLIALKSVGQKSIQPCAFEHCARENMLWSQDKNSYQTQMLVVGAY